MWNVFCSSLKIDTEKSLKNVFRIVTNRDKLISNHRDSNITFPFYFTLTLVLKGLFNKSVIFYGIMMFMGQRLVIQAVKFCLLICYDWSYRPLITTQYRAWHHVLLLENHETRLYAKSQSLYLCYNVIRCFMGGV